MAIRKNNTYICRLLMLSINSLFLITLAARREWKNTSKCITIEELWEFGAKVTSR
jgi:hypothetical protein